MAIKQVLKDGDERHPMWRVLNTAIVLVFVTLVKYLQGESIDSDFLTWLLGVLGSFEVGKAFVNRRVNR